MSSLSGRILLDHGKGGAAAQGLLGDLFLKHLSSPVLHCLEDSALLEEHTGRLAFSTDSFINEPSFFPGGNLGSLAVYGTINNLAMRGAMPLALSLSVIIEEGFPLAELEEIVKSVGFASEVAEVAIVTGDTRVVPRGKIGGICLNTSGIGLVRENYEISGANIEVNDTILLSGTIGDHGLAVDPRFSHLQTISSEIAPLHLMINAILETYPDAVHALRDPTRGGLATSLLWLASASAVCLEIEQHSIPIAPAVRQVCDQRVIDPLYLPSDGRCILCCDPQYALEILALLRNMEAGQSASIIGHVRQSPAGRVRLHQEDGKHSFISVR